jgi:hypothetical protein
MKNVFKAVLAALLVAGSASAALADDGQKDFGMNFGYKLWLNSWQTTIASNHAQGGDHYTGVTQGGYGSVPNLSLRYKQGFLSMGYLASGTYTFPQYTDVINVAGVPHTETVSVAASRTEFDMNLGFMFVPQFGATVGYKNVTQTYNIYNASPGLVYGNNGATNHTYMNGVTFGVVGGAPIGNGFSLYGNGVGGFMVVNYGPTPATTNDSATYIASELGLAWRAERVPLSLTLGYKYQIISTRVAAGNNAVLNNQVGLDVTNGYMLGANYSF